MLQFNENNQINQITMENILSKIDIDEVYKDIYAQPEYRKLAEKHKKFKISGNIAQALIYAKKMKDYEVGVFEGVARRYIDANRITCDWVSAMPENDRKYLSILSYSAYMLSDVLDNYIMDLNQLMKKHTDHKVYGFDKLNIAIKEARKVVTHFDGTMNDDKAISMFGDISDKLYKMIFNQASSYYNKLKDHAEKANKNTSRNAKVA